MDVSVVTFNNSKTFFFEHYIVISHYFHRFQKKNIFSFFFFHVQLLNMEEEKNDICDLIREIIVQATNALSVKQKNSVKIFYVIFIDSKIALRKIYITYVQKYM